MRRLVEPCAHIDEDEVKTDAIKVTAGLQVTGNSEKVFESFIDVDYFIQGESEFVLLELIDKLNRVECFIVERVEEKLMKHLNSFN